MGNTQLMVAAMNGKDDIVELLINPTNLNTQNNDGDTALMWAIKK